MGSKVNEYIKKEWFYSAAIELAEIFAMSTDKDKQSLNPTIFLSPNELKIVLETSKEDYQQIINILSFGTNWDEDEMLLIFTNLINLRILSKYFHNFQINLDIDFERIENLFNEIDKKKNSRSINLAVKLINKNHPVNDIIKLSKIYALTNE